MLHFHHLNRLVLLGALATSGLVTETVRAQPLPDGQLIDEALVAFSADQQAQLQARIPSADDLLRHVEIKRITYLSDGLKVKGYLILPTEGNGLPCVIYNRGGNRDFGALTDEGVAIVLAPLASRGYVVAASQYRGVAGGEGSEEFGGAEINDVLSLIPLLEQSPRADASRIGMFGWSRGGLMTYLAMTRTDKLDAAIVGAGLADAFDEVERRPEMEQFVLSELVPNWSEQREAALIARSPIRWIDQLHKKTPILLLHGTADWRVHPTQALRMASALYENGHPFRFCLFEGGDHGLSEHAGEVDRLVNDWLDHYVRDQHDWPSLEPHGR